MVDTAAEVRKCRRDTQDIDRHNPNQSAMVSRTIESLVRVIAMVDNPFGHLPGEEIAKRRRFLPSANALGESGRERLKL